MFAANTLLGMYNDYKAALDKSVKPSSRAFEILEDIHGLASGFKAVSTWAGEHHGEQLKQACGGHGYLQASGLT